MPGVINEDIRAHQGEIMNQLRQQVESNWPVNPNAQGRLLPPVAPLLSRRLRLR
jgi:hypothetical protein